MVLLGGGWTGKAGQEERAGESWSEGGERGHCLEELNLETESPEMPLFPLSLGHDSGSHLQEPGEKSFISFLLFFFWQVYLISFELPLFGPKKCPKGY